MLAKSMEFSLLIPIIYLAQCLVVLPHEALTALKIAPLLRKVMIYTKVENVYC